MSSEKEIKSLEHKIADINLKLQVFKDRKIQKKRIKALEMKKLKFETLLEEIQYA